MEKENRKSKERFLFIFESADPHNEVPVANRLRRMLKFALRSCDLRCVEGRGNVGRELERDLQECEGQ